MKYTEILWCDARLPAEFHYFANSDHGYGLKNDGEEVNEWIEILYKFMTTTNFIEKNNNN